MGYLKDSYLIQYTHAFDIYNVSTLSFTAPFIQSYVLHICMSTV